MGLGAFSSPGAAWGKELCSPRLQVQRWLCKARAVLLGQDGLRPDSRPAAMLVGLALLGGERGLGWLSSAASTSILSPSARNLFTSARRHFTSARNHFTSARRRFPSTRCHFTSARRHFNLTSCHLTSAVGQLLPSCAIYHPPPQVSQPAAQGIWQAGVCGVSSSTLFLGPRQPSWLPSPSRPVASSLLQSLCHHGARHGARQQRGLADGSSGHRVLFGLG